MRSLEGVLLPLPPDSKRVDQDGGIWFEHLRGLVILRLLPIATPECYTKPHMRPSEAGPESHALQYVVPRINRCRASNRWDRALASSSSLLRRIARQLLQGRHEGAITAAQTSCAAYCNLKCSSLQEPRSWSIVNDRVQGCQALITRESFEIPRMSFRDASHSRVDLPKNDPGKSWFRHLYNHAIHTMCLPAAQQRLAMIPAHSVTFIVSVELNLYSTSLNSYLLRS